MKKILVPLFLLVMTGCNLEDEVSSLGAMSDTEKVWVFAQFNVMQEESGLESYYYYAKVSKSLYESISQNKIKNGFILLEEVKYWGDDDLIYDYKDVENSGQIVFRIDAIVKIDLVNKAPEVGKGYEQFEDDEPKGGSTD